MKTAFLFPGQGSQYVGMAQDFYENDTDIKNFIDRADDCLDFDLKKVMFTPNELINQTEYTQSVMLVATLAAKMAVEKRGVSPSITAGLSLGEYAALVTAKAIDEFDAIKIVRKRGIFMEKALPKGKGGMAAVIGLENDVIESVCSDVTKTTGQLVVVANYNCPGQTVISGYMESVDKASEILREKNARLVQKLSVSGPFHSPLLESAGKNLEAELEKYTINTPNIPYIANVNAQVVTDKKDIKTSLVKQIYSPVRWEETMQKLVSMGVERFIEIGPGKTIAGFFKRVDRSIDVKSISSISDLDKL